jgi:enediyne biosynthesis protein E4
MNKISIIIFAALFIFFSNCSQNKTTAKQDSPIRFSSLPSSSTNIHFNNIITENDTISLVNNAYAYMGSGIGIGDFNNDGLQDVFFGGNQVSSKLYINKGNFQFEDVTEKAGLTTSSWVTGVSIIDINNDGLDDIYLCTSIYYDPARRVNKLFINQGNLQFTEMAKEYGLNDTSYSAQAVFFDYDKDGDLDMYLLNHMMNHKISNDIVPKNSRINSAARDKLFRNNGIDKQTGHPYFEDVSKAAGIMEDGYGLGVAVTDINKDGWPDLYVANDYLANDLLWINNKNGTFSNTIARSAKHQSYSSMGVDANDINNDGLVDIVSLDMMPETNYRQKMMYTFLNYDRFVMEQRAGYEPQFIRNMLQLNNGIRNINDTNVVFFSEVGQLAGISETDWSWSVLMADLDNDGLRDMHITNGMGRDMINSDFITYYAATVQRSVSDFKGYYQNLMKKLNAYGTVELHNYCYRNNGGLGFTDVSKIAGIGDTAVSNGCAYADLDNDGDLDLLVNNINKEAFVLRNDARAAISDSINNFINIELIGDSLNKKGLGAKVTVFAGGKMQYAEQYPVRGYLSTVDKRLHFGTGKLTTVDSVKITWPDGKQQALSNVKSNSLLKINYTDALQSINATPAITKELFTDITGSRGINFKHKETFFYDYGYQQLLPQKYSQLGPFITEGDINGDGLTDFFVSGAKGQWGKIFTQQKDGNFIARELGSGDKPQEDLGCLLFDADGDKDLDLFINSGGAESAPGSSDYLPRLYVNDGKGNFTYDQSALPQTIFTSAQCVAAGDYDGDGDLDIFIGGRLVPRQYPAIPNSYLLQNNEGKFTIVTQDVCPELENAGMVTSAIWTDFDGDKKQDLIIAGEWMSIKFFKNNGVKLIDVTTQTGLNNFHGQWRSLQVADLDKDGDLDIVAGNLGLNNHYKASEQYPIKLFAKDIDGNGSIDPIVAYYRQGQKGVKELFPGITREQFAAQVPLVKKKYLYNKDYAVSDMDNVLTGTSRDDLLEFTCNETRTVWLENKESGKFIVHALPVEAQFAPVNGIICTDVNNDGNADIIIAGNEYQTEVMTGRYDASYGLLLTGDGKGNFIPVLPVNSGLIIDGDVKDLKLLRTNKNERIILAGINDEQLKTFLLK